MRKSNAAAKSAKSIRKPTSSSTRSKRSNNVSKSPAADNNGTDATELDGTIDRTESATVEGEAGDRILAQGGADCGASGIAVSPLPYELMAITLIQPWASLIAKGYKQYETRDWSTNYRGPIAIHAGRKPAKWNEHKLLVNSFKDLLGYEDCEYSSVIAIAELTDCILMTEEFIKQQSTTELRCGNWAVGRYAFKLENIRAIEPISATGKQGLWKWITDSTGGNNSSSAEREAALKRLIEGNGVEILRQINRRLQLNNNSNEQTFKAGDRIAWCVADSNLGKVGTVTKISDELITWFYDGSTTPTNCLVSQCQNFIRKLDQQLTVDDSWNPSAFGETQHKAEENGQLNLLEWDVNEPPEPDDFDNLEDFKIAFDEWGGGEPTKEEEREHPHIKAEEIWNQSRNGNGLTCAVASESDSPLQGLSCGGDRPTSYASGMDTANQFSDNDSPIHSDSATLNHSVLKSENLQQLTEELTSLQLHPPANHSQLTESDSEQPMIETASQQSSEQLMNLNQSSQSSKMLPDCLAVTTNQKLNTNIFHTYSDSLSRAGTMRNGQLSAAPILPAPGVGKDCLLLRSPGALSGDSKMRPPGKSRLETQLLQLELITNSEVVNPEFLEAGYQLPIGFSNPNEQRTALELAIAQTQQSQQPQQSIAPSSELPPVMETTAIAVQHLETLLIGGLPQLHSSESNISIQLPANIGALSKTDLLASAIEQHQIVSNIERKEFELGLEKLHRARITGLYLQELKKRCGHGEFESELESNGIKPRRAQHYMSIAKNWAVIESEAKAQTVALLVEENQSFGIKWALDTIAQQKKLKSAAPPPADPDCWRTPNTRDQPIVELVQKALGGSIWCDPCADPGHKIPAAVHYSRSDDGLAEHQIWSKTVFINPPFSDPLPWVQKCCFSIGRGECSAAVMLLKSGTVSNVGTGELINKYATATCHWRGRINFLNDEGVAVKGSDFDCVFVYFGSRFDLFRSAFADWGTTALLDNIYANQNKKYLAVDVDSEAAPALSPPAFSSTKQEADRLAAAVGLSNGKSGVLPDVRDRDRELHEQYDPHTVLANTVTIDFDKIETESVQEPVKADFYEAVKQRCLNDYITAISSNLADFSNEQIAFLAKIINEESAKRIGF